MHDLFVLIFFSRAAEKFVRTHYCTFKTISSPSPQKVLFLPLFDFYSIILDRWLLHLYLCSPKHLEGLTHTHTRRHISSLTIFSTMASLHLQCSFINRNEEKWGARGEWASWMGLKAIRMLGGRGEVYDPDREKCSSLINIPLCWHLPKWYTDMNFTKTVGGRERENYF